MKLVRDLFVFIGMLSLVIGIISKFYKVPIIFADITPLAHVVFANTCLLIALTLKILND